MTLELDRRVEMSQSLHELITHMSTLETYCQRILIHITSELNHRQGIDKSCSRCQSYTKEFAQLSDTLWYKGYDFMATLKGGF